MRRFVGATRGRIIEIAARRVGLDRIRDCIHKVGLGFALVAAFVILAVDRQSAIIVGELAELKIVHVTEEMRKLDRELGRVPLRALAPIQCLGNSRPIEVLGLDRLVEYFLLGLAEFLGFPCDRIQPFRQRFDLTGRGLLKLQIGVGVSERPVVLPALRRFLPALRAAFLVRLGLSYGS